MKLFLLKAINNPGLDSYDGFVVYAQNEDEARGIAQANGADETGYASGYPIQFWLDETKTTCVPLSMVFRPFRGSFSAHITQPVNTQGATDETVSLDTQ